MGKGHSLSGHPAAVKSIVEGSLQQSRAAEDLRVAEHQIRYDDGTAYERMMGAWESDRGQDLFLDWLAPPPGLRWIDIGCGNGAFTELLVERCAPAEVQGIDPF